MKAVLITYNQAYYDEIAAVLNNNGVKGFTEWNEIKGHGSNTQRHHQHRPRRGRRRHYEPTSRERPQDPGFGAEGV